MKLFYRIFIVIVLAITNHSVYSQDTTVVDLTAPGTVGACLSNAFSIEFNVTDTQRLSLFTYIDGITDNVCGSSSPTSVFIVVDSASQNLTNEQTILDSLSTTWTATITDTGTFTMWYHIYIDCSITSTSNINLVQSLTDSLGGFVYHISPSDTNVFQSVNVVYPVIQDITVSPFLASYLNTNYLIFKYRNNSIIPANIKFLFKPDSTDYNGQLFPTNLEFKAGTAGTYASLTPNFFTPAFIPAFDTLFVRQTVIDSSCLVTDTVKAFFSWECNNPPTDSGLFCSNCSNVYEKNYSVWNGNVLSVTASRISPPDSIASWDNSCINDSSGMPLWEFRITNSGIGALDSIVIVLSEPDANPNLTLIPLSSISIDTICNNCSATVNATPRINALCDTIYPTSSLLGSLRITAKNFQEIDTIVVRFRTFRCGEEDAGLMNQDKYFNQWTLPVTYTDICGTTAIIPSSNPPYYGGQRGISSNWTNGGPDLDLSTTFIPSASDLSILPNQGIFGQSATMEIDLLGLMTSTADYQIFGYNQSSNVPKGYLRAVINCQTGLIIQNPASDVRLKLFKSSTGTYIYNNPVYYHTTVPDSTCQPGDYYFYFNLSDSAMLSFLSAGFFEFTLQACCADNAIPTGYSVAFYVMPNPDSCFTLSFADTTHLNPPPCVGLGCAWIPLESEGNFINVHCPGCKKPGMIVDDYYMRRTTYGLQDSNNDGRADSLSAQIVPGSTWFNNNLPVLKTRYSSLGDELEDFLTAHFQEGDPTGANDSVKGYTYAQMVADSVFLHYLQLDRTITAALDTLEVLPLEFTLYIDKPDGINPNCIDCNGYNIDTLNTRTQHILHVSGSDVYHYMDTIISSNRYFFTFNTFDSSGVLSGNLHDTLNFTDPGSFIFTDTLTPFTGFFEGQFYRLYTRYSECGSFSGGANPTQASVKKVSTISNKMWFSGDSLPHNAYSNSDEAPNTIFEMHTEYWTFDTLACDSCTLINQNFADSHYFLCETYGGFHFFFSQEFNNTSALVNDSACNKLINAGATGRIAGNLINVYPNEYRPPSYDALSYRVEVPTGYHIIQSRVQNTFTANAQACSTNWRNFISPATIGTFILYDSILPPPACLPDSVTFGGNGFPFYATDTLQYIGSRNTQRVVQFLLEPDSCNTDPFYPTDSSVVISYDLAQIACINNATCQLDTIRSVNTFITAGTPPLVNHPNLTVQYVPFLMFEHHQVCDSIQISNPPTIISPLNYPSTAAANVFISVPDSLAIPFLYNWVFYTPTDTTYAVGNIIPIAATMQPSISATISGLLCADYITCSPDTNFDIYIGWNCDTFPSSPFIPDSVCEADVYNIAFENAAVNINPIGKVHPADYDLCDPFEISSQYISTNSGGVYPLLLEIDTLFPGLIPLYALVYNCNSTLHDTLSFGSDSLTWIISGANMDSIGEPDSAIEATCINFHIWFMPECAFGHQTTLPNVILHSQSYCGFAFTDTTNFENPPAFEQDSSICNGCFTVTKSVFADTATAYNDTIQYEIIVCANNATPDTVFLVEQLPYGFVLTSPNVPDTLLMPAQGCDTLYISGYFTIPSNCSIPASINTVYAVTTASDTISAQACLPVMEECFDSTMVLIPDSTYSSTLPAVVYTNDSLYIDGRFYINDDFWLYNCKVYVATGGQIIVLADSRLHIDSGTIVTGCATMWRNIMLESHSELYVLNRSGIFDAEEGIYAKDSCEFRVLNSDIIDCMKGIYVPPFSLPYRNNINATVRGSRFGLFNTYLKDPYSGQASYYKPLPAAGIDASDVVWTIGHSSADSNYFYNINKGIIGWRSELSLVNNKYFKILDDSNYTEDYSGTAMTCLGDTANHHSSVLNVLPVASNTATVDSSYRGVYTDYSELTVTSTKIFNVNTGVYSVRCIGNLTSLVTACTITASSTGIYWRLNVGTGGMTASDNEIYATGIKSAGIYLNETSNSYAAPYIINCNYVEDIDGNGGIIGANLNSPSITQNTIRFLDHSQGTMEGIKVSGCYRASVTYNNVKSNSVDSADINKTGIYVSISTYNKVSCNIVDSTGKGFFFGGVCGNTSFKDNVIKDHYVGLYLNSVAVIDQQPPSQIPPWHGNTWLDTTHYVSGYGAVNLNADSLSILLTSLFTTYQGDPSYNPKIPLDTNSIPFYVDDGGWFDLLPLDSTYSCPSMTSCDEADLMGGDDGSEELMMMIAEGNTLTSDYIPESNMIAGQLLYEELNENPDLLLSNIIYQDFIDGNENTSIGYLHEAKKALAEIGKFNAEESTQLMIIDSIIDIFRDSIFRLDSINMVSPISNYSALRGNYIAQIALQHETRHSIWEQKHASDLEQLDLVEDANNNASTTQIPDENEKFINNIEIVFQRNGISPLLQYYEDILAIAQQCPYSGGAAVYRARAFIQLFNENEEYDDEANCLQQGIYKQGQNEGDMQTQNDILIKPNPANDIADIILRGNFEGICKIIIEDVTGRLIYNGIFECDEKQKVVNTRAFVSGVYHVKVFINDNFIKTAKLVIAR